jgi:hypothetical protein
MTTIVSGSEGITLPDNSQIATYPAGWRNRIINGDMRIDQRNAGASVTLSSTGQYPADRFPCARDTVAATITAQQSATVPAGFAKSILWTTSTGAAPGASDDNFVSHRIEGFNFADLGFGTSGAQSFTLSFWVRSSVVGTYGISLNNNGANRCFMATYTIDSANTYEYKTITVPGDTTGTWLTDNGIGLRLFWDMGAGASRSIAASSAWGSSYGTGLTGGVKLIQNTGATFYLTGVQLEKGSVATPFEYIDYSEQERRCLRYCPVLEGGGSSGYFGMGSAPNSTAVQVVMALPVPARVAPTSMTITAADIRVSDFQNAPLTPSGATMGACTKTAASINFTVSGATQYRPYATHFVNTTTKIIFNGCEL